VLLGVAGAQAQAPAIREGLLQVGDDAPDFTLKTLDGTADVQLSTYRGECPVALVFGSYT
jgi:peroxiredoxin